MAKFTVYTKTVCSYCTAAKGLMIAKKYEYEERNVETSEAFMAELRARLPNNRKVPQIYLGDYHIGGYEDLKEAQKNGLIEMLLETQNG